MSWGYDRYLTMHRANVAKGFRWLLENLPEVVPYIPGVDYEWQLVKVHDMSKDEPDEYDAYDAYFYGENKTFAVKQAFNKAWLLHIHRNPHHWQYWVLVNDDPEEGTILIDMEYNYIVEMICDWWAFSWVSDKLDEIFKWYDEHRDYIQLSNKTRYEVENILSQMKKKLEETSNE